MPLGGMRLRFTARLIAHCSPNWMRQRRDRRGARRGSDCRCAPISARMTMKPMSATRHEAEEDAELARRRREHIVGMRVGDQLLGDRLARAAPEPAALEQRGERLVDLVGVAVLGIDEGVDALGEVREEDIGAEQQPDARRRPAPKMMHHEMPERNSSAAQVASISAVCPISGCSSRPATMTSMSSVARMRAGIALLLHALGEQPRADHGEGRLDELGRLDGLPERPKSSASRP